MRGGWCFSGLMGGIKQDKADKNARNKIKQSPLHIVWGL